MTDFHTVELGKGQTVQIKSLRQFVFKNLTISDVSNMYEKYQGKPSIRLWCYNRTTKIESTSSTKCGSKDGKDGGEVDKLYEQLQKKHEGI